MPRGIYPHVMTPARIKSIKKNFAKGRSKKAREKAIASLKENGKDPNWRRFVSQVTKEAMHRPEIREKHLKGLADAWGHPYELEHPERVPAGMLSCRDIPQEFVARFWSRVDIKETDECWYFQKAPTSDYGAFWYGVDEISAHRFVMMLKLKRYLKDGEQSLHHCDHPGCCNPRHLFLGTHADNMADKKRKGRSHNGGRKKK